MDKTEVMVPDALEKLLKFLCAGTDVKIALDYSPKAVPRTATDGTIILPAYMYKRQIVEQIAVSLHESWHASKDQDALRAIGMLRNHPAALNLLHNVVLDARDDQNRVREFAGALTALQTLYDVNAAKEEKITPATPLKGALGSILGFDEHDNHFSKAFEQLEKRDEIKGLLEATKDKRGTLLREALILLALLASDKKMPPPPVPKTLQPRDGDPKGGREIGNAMMTALGDKSKKTMGLLIDPKFRRLVSLAAAEVFGDFRQGQAGGWCLDGGKSGSGQGQSSCQFGPGCGHNIKFTPPSTDEIAAAKGAYLDDAVRRFVETAEMVFHQLDDKDVLVAERLPLALTEPDRLFDAEMMSAITRGTAVDILVDGSGSMSSPLASVTGSKTRYAWAAHGAKRWVEACLGIGCAEVEVGITVFGDQAIRVAPLAALDEFYNTNVTNVMNRGRERCGGGTDLGDAMQKSIEALENSTAKRRCMLIFSDGEVEVDSVVKAREDAQRVGIRPVALTIGGDVSHRPAQLADLFEFSVEDSSDFDLVLARALLRGIEG